MPKYDQTDIVDPTCGRCTPDGPEPFANGTACDFDGSVGVDGDCNDPGCINGVCIAKAIPNPDDEPEDVNPYDCRKPICQGGAEAELELDNVIGVDGKCLLCGFGVEPIDDCQDSYDRELILLVESLERDITGTLPNPSRDGPRFVINMIAGFVMGGQIAENSGNEKDVLDRKLLDCHDNCEFF